MKTRLRNIWLTSIVAVLLAGCAAPASDPFPPADVQFGQGAIVVVVDDPRSLKRRGALRGPSAPDASP